MSKVVTRIAPSPTGDMHIGTARTALFNWLYARGRNGKFLLRIEDTDKGRSTQAAKDAILTGMAWLGLDFDGDPISQSERAPRHIEIAYKLLETGQAYKCFLSEYEIDDLRSLAIKNKSPAAFRSPWREAPPSTFPNKPFVIRIKAPQSGATIINDEVQGNISIQNNQLDDMVLLRSDGTPVYMLAVAVDDHDMGVTHIIRGDDHLNNAARQNLIYSALNWNIPVYAHIPLIHGEDGKKLSKRNLATSVIEYKKMGYPASAMRNYLARLGWSHGDDEFFTDEQAKKWFDLQHIGKSPSRFDFKKLSNISKLHIANTDNAALLHELIEYLNVVDHPRLAQNHLNGLLRSLDFTKSSVKSFPELIEKNSFILKDRPITIDPDVREKIEEFPLKTLKILTPQLQNVKWDRSELEELLNSVCEQVELKFRTVAPILRAALAGSSKTPSVFDMMTVLGREETIERLIEFEVKYNNEI